MERTKYRKRINSLTGLRFWMIIIVVLSHLGCLSNGYPYSSFYNQFLDNAVMGVDFFFMLSGFGMMYSYGRSSLLTSIRGGITLQLTVLKKYIPFILPH